MASPPWRGNLHKQESRLYRVRWESGYTEGVAAGCWGHRLKALRGSRAHSTKQYCRVTQMVCSPVPSLAVGT